MNPFYYQVGGSLDDRHLTYVARDADAELYDALLAGEFCYVLDCRQVGKSSLLVRTKSRLQAEGYRCTYLDMTQIGSDNITPPQWYKGVVSTLWLGFDLLGKFNLKAWWRESEEVSVLQRLSRFIEELLDRFAGETIFIFIDEIDSILSLDFSVDDFFALIRFCYNQRAHDPKYKRLAFALFGVATPSDLIRDKNRTPFNLGKAIKLPGFKRTQVQPLVGGLVGNVPDPEAAMEEILSWTGGQPFLTQKLCQLVANGNWKPGSDRYEMFLAHPQCFIRALVNSRIVQNWRSQDEPEHLKTISDRILNPQKYPIKLLTIYREILQQKSIKFADIREHVELILSGAVVNENGELKVKNSIYERVFDIDWVETQLNHLSPAEREWWAGRNPSEKLPVGHGITLAARSPGGQGHQISGILPPANLAAKDVTNPPGELNPIPGKALGLQCDSACIGREKKVNRQRVFLGVAIAGLIFASVMGLSSFFKYRQASLNEIKAIAQSSEFLLASNRTLDALFATLKAKHQLQNLGENHPELDRQLDVLLRQAVYGGMEYNRLSGHTGTVNDVDIGPDAELIATGSGDQTVKLWRRDGKLLQTLRGHSAAVWGVSISPDGNLIASASGDRTVKLWKPDGTLVRTLTGHQGIVRDVTFSPDGERIASASGDNTIKLWTRDGAEQLTLRGHQAQVLDVTFSPDGERIASASGDNTIKLWTSNGKLLHTFTGHEARVYSVKFTPDGETLVSGSWDYTVKLWRRDGTLIHTLVGHQDAVNHIAIAPDGQRIASASWDKTIRLWNIDGTAIATLKGHGDRVFGVDFCPNGTRIASASWDGTVKLWRSDRQFIKTLEGHTDKVYKLSFSPDGEMLASSSADGTIKLWRRDGSAIATLTGHRDRVYGLEFSPEGDRIASGSWDHTVKLWTADGTVIRTLAGHRDRVFNVAFSPDGEWLASASADKTVKLWPRQGKNPLTLTGHTDEVFDVDWSPDGQRLASASLDGTVKLWNRQGREIATLQGHRDAAIAVTFSPDGDTLASGSLDGTVKRWNREGRLLQSLSHHREGVFGLAFSPDGETLASASLDATVKLTNRQGELLHTLAAHREGVFGVAFSPDGQMLASSSEDQRAILWDLDRVLHLDSVLAYSCRWISHYLHHNLEVDRRDRHLCDGVQMPPP